MSGPTVFQPGRAGSPKRAGDALRTGGELRRAQALHRTAYEDTTTFVENFADLTNFALAANTGQVSGNAFYSNGDGTNNPSGGNRSLALGSGESLRIQTRVKYVTGGSFTGLTLVGIATNTAGAAPVTNGVNLVAVGLSATQGLILWNAGGVTVLNASLVAGDYWISIMADATYLSFAVTSADGATQYTTRVTRVSIGTLNNLAIWNNDSRGLSGNWIDRIGLRKSTATIAPRTNVEGNAPSIGRFQANTQDIRIILPATYDSRVPTPLVIFAHGAGQDCDTMYNTAGEKSVANALVAAGYILAASTANADGWGNAASQASYLALYQYVRDRYAVSHVLLLAVSMGGLAALNLIQKGTVPCAGCALISPVVDIRNLYNIGTYSSSIEAAYGFSGAANLAAATLGNDPSLQSGAAFAGVPLLAFASTADTVVPRASNTDPLIAKVAPFAREATTTASTGNHGDASSYSPSGVLAFFNRCIAS